MLKLTAMGSGGEAPSQKFFETVGQIGNLPYF